MRKKSVIFFIISLFLFNSCGENPFESDPMETIKRGEIVEIISENDFTVEELNEMFSAFAGFNDLEINLRYGVTVYSAVYKTVDPQGNLIDASGLFVLPLKESPSPIISLHHGTQSKRDRVGSVNMLSSFDALFAGGLGYVALSPDMLGLGISTVVHPYHIREINANTAIDFIRAVKNYFSKINISVNGQLFLSGYSQGGYTTMAVHKKIQEDLSDEFIVTASAPMAGAHDLLSTARFIIEKDEYERPSFLSFITYSYSYYYGWNDLSMFFQNSYVNLIPTLFNGTLSTEEIDGALPKKISDLFNSSFLTAMKNGNEELFTFALEENSLLDWGPKAPVLIVHGNEDSYVPYQNALTAKQNWEANGAVSVELVTIEGGDHVSSILPAMLSAISWFEKFRTDIKYAVNF